MLVIFLPAFWRLEHLLLRYTLIMRGQMPRPVTLVLQALQRLEELVGLN